jgi:histidinol-phosphate aminotransferase
VNSLSQAVAAEALREKSRAKSFIRTIVSERKRLAGELEKIEGIRPFPSEANFILFRVGNPDKVYASLLGRGVLVRNINESVKGCLRVTVGAPAENAAFLKALRQIVRGEG